ncbi:MAG: hypothetical protein HC828_03745 [Blastochloris sp.]|nr:hypothetical protein [Blastochloris sp.]
MTRKRFYMLLGGVFLGNCLGLALTTAWFDRSWLEFLTSLAAIIIGIGVVGGVAWVWLGRTPDSD